MSTTLGGYLIGYEIEKRNGSHTRVIFEQPIHNTITAACLDNLLMFNGDNAIPSGNEAGNYLSMFVKSSQASNRYGVINYCGLGSGTGTTNVNDTALKNLVGNITDTKKTGNGWCGTSISSANATLSLRVSHTHTITEDFTITEIGWFNRIYPSGEFTLSARVQLDNPVPVEAGDTFYTIYELTIGFQDVERFSDFAGLGAGYKVNCCNYTNQSDGLIYSLLPGLNYSCVPASAGVSGGNPDFLRPWMRPIYMLSHSIGYMGGQMVHYLGRDLNKSKAFISQTNVSSLFPSINRGTVEVANYVPGSFKRDASFISEFNNITTYGLVFNGTLYRFGDYDEQDVFTPRQVTLNGSYKFTIRQSWSTELLQPSA